MLIYFLVSLIKIKTFLTLIIITNQSQNSHEKEMWTKYKITINIIHSNKDKNLDNTANIFR